MNMAPLTVSQSSALVRALEWINATVVGPLGTGIAILAVAGIGYGLLSGRLDIRRGLAVIIGTFLIFGAPSIVTGVRNNTDRLAGGPTLPEGPALATTDTIPPPQRAEPYDPYAGASLIQRK